MTVDEARAALESLFDDGLVVRRWDSTAGRWRYWVPEFAPLDAVYSARSGPRDEEER